MAKEFWARVARYSDISVKSDPNCLSVIIPLQPQHVTAIGVTQQQELTGSGAVDVKIVLPEMSNEAWTEEKASSFCLDELTGFKQRGSDEPIEATSQLFQRSVENLPGAELTRIVRAPSGLVGQEISLSQAQYRAMMSEAETDITSYYFLREIGSMCMKSGNFDAQPLDFRSWITQVYSGSLKPPSKRPEAWAKKNRDQLVYSLVTNLCLHGFSPYRNEVTARRCASDIVASACLKARIRGISSYETVRKIYQRNQHSSVGKTTI